MAEEQHEPVFEFVSAGPSDPIKHRQGKALSSGEKTIAYNVFLRHMPHQESKTKSVELAACTVGISNTTMWKIVVEFERTGKASSPPKNRTKAKAEGKQLGRKQILDEDNKNKIRSTVQNLFMNNEIPTLNKILQALQSDEEFPSINRSSLHRYLKRLGFQHEKRGGKQYLIEKPEIPRPKKKTLICKRNLAKHESNKNLEG